MLARNTNLEDFYRRIGAAGKIKFLRPPPLSRSARRKGEMQAGFLPAPFHLNPFLRGFATADLLDKFSIARAMLDILQTRGSLPISTKKAASSMLEWSAVAGQTKRAIERFWRVSSSALSMKNSIAPTRASALTFSGSFSLHTAPAIAWSPRRPARQSLRRLQIRNRASRRGSDSARPSARPQIESGDSPEFASTKDRKKRPMLTSSPCPNFTGRTSAESVKQSDPSLANLDKIKVAPITGVHFWFDRPVMDEPFVTLLDTTNAMDFQQDALYADSNEKRKKRSRWTNCNSSSARLMISCQKPRQEIIDLCLAEVAMPYRGLATLN